MVLVIIFGFASFFLGGFFSAIYFVLCQKKDTPLVPIFFY